MTSRTIIGMWAQPLAAKGAFKRRIAIVGGGDEAARAMTALDESPDIDVQILGMYDDRTDDRSPPVVCGYRKLGNLAKLVEDARRGEIDLIIMAIPMTAHVRLMQLLPKLWALPVEVRVCGQAIDMKLSPSAYGYLGKLPLLNVFSRQLAQGTPWLKEVFERTLAMSLLVALSPLLCIIALLVATTGPGPILMREEHRSFDGSPLDLFCFRTTRHGDGGPTEELTAIGRILERLKLSRLPYLFNIIAGDIAFVGPAPHDSWAQGDVGHYQRVANAYCLRHDIKPGLTGWAQIHGMRRDSGDPEAIENRVKYDLEYVDRTSTWFDLQILLKTPFAWIRYERPAYTI
jgi:lipopolysaccharide/colanic/teichoic acid biosynthesis glycosyltransferase